MSNHFSTSDSFSQHQPHWMVAVLIAVALHVVLIGIAIFWEPTYKPPKTRNKVFVQTVQVSSNRPPAAQQVHAAPSPAPKPAEVPPIVAEATIPLAAEPIREEPLKPKPKPEAPPVVPAKTPPPKVESPPKPKTVPAKPTPKEDKKPVPAKKPAPTPKVVEPVKKEVKAEPEKSKKADEAEKKRQQEQAEAEKKRQKELEEAQKKQKEIDNAKIAKVQENLAKIGKSRENIASHSTISLDATALPKELGAMQIDALPVGDTGNPSDWGAQEISYREKVAGHLKKALKLPDFGAVTIKLTITREGKVVKVETTQSENSKNKAYVEREVMQLQFPRFGKEFPGSSEYTFQYHLHNDT